ELAQGQRRVRDRAEHQAGDRGVEASACQRKRGGDAVAHADPHRCAARGLDGSLAEVGLRLERDDLVDRRGVVLEVHAVAGPDLHYPAGKTGEELVPVVADLLLHHPADPVHDPRSDRVSYLRRCALWWGHGRYWEFR